MDGLICILWQDVRYVCTGGTSHCRQGIVSVLLGGNVLHILGDPVVLSCLHGCRRVATVSVVSPVISAHWYLAASWAWHLDMVVVSDRSFLWRRASTVSPSRRPAMIWYRRFFWQHSSTQKLHVLASSLRPQRSHRKTRPVAACVGGSFCVLPTRLSVPLRTVVPHQRSS